MKKMPLVFLMLCAMSALAQKVKPNPNKDAIVKSVDKHQQELIAVSDKI